MFRWDQDDVIDAGVIATVGVIVALAGVGLVFLLSKLWVIVS